MKLDTHLGKHEKAHLMQTNYKRYLKGKLKITLGVSEMSNLLKNTVNESFPNFRQPLFFEFETFN